jgi:hypothetical protein
MGSQRREIQYAKTTDIVIRKRCYYLTATSIFLSMSLLVGKETVSDKIHFLSSILHCDSQPLEYEVTPFLKLW